MKKAVHAVISGRVQGVWYRAWVLDTAKKLGLYGWVRNKKNGEVEAVFCGDDANVDKMIEQCWQGSPLSKVSNVTLAPTEMVEDKSFEVLRSC